MTDAAAFCEEELRARDRDRFLSALFAPAPLRPRLHALYAFDLDLATIASRVREPMAGEIRLQWWRDVVHGERAGEAAAHPVAAALLAVRAAADLPVDIFDGLLEARAFDLYTDPMPTVAAFEAYAAQSRGAVPMLAALALGAPRDAALAEAARLAGLATAYARALAGFAADSSRGRLVLPQEVFVAHGVDVADILAGRGSPALLAAFADLGGRALDAAARAREAVSRLAPSAKPAFLEAALVPPVIRLIRRRGYDPFRSVIELPQWRRQWHLWRAARTW